MGKKTGAANGDNEGRERKGREKRAANGLDKGKEKGARKEDGE